MNFNRIFIRTNNNENYGKTKTQCDKSLLQQM